MADLPAEVIARVDQGVHKLEANPYCPGTRKLRGISGYRFRVGRYRILYDVDAGTRTVTIYGVRHRKDAYR